MAAMIRGRRDLRAALLLAGCAVLALGCATDERLADDWVSKASAREASAPMAGEALAQRKLELDRSYRNLGHFLKTLDALHRRGDRSGQVMFSEFADFYVAKHVVPLLESEWQSRHPEVALLDVNTRFAVTSLWVKIGSTSSASRTRGHRAPARSSASCSRSATPHLRSRSRISSVSASVITACCRA